MSTTVTLHGRTFDYDVNVIGGDGYAWTRPYPGDSTGNVLFSLLDYFLLDVLDQKAGIASVSGVAPSSAGNVLLSDGTNWVRSHGSGITALLDALTVAGATSLNGLVTVNRAGGTPSIVGSADLVLDANSGGGANTVFLNAFNSGPVDIAAGGGATTIHHALTVVAGGITVQSGTSAFQAATFGGNIDLASTFAVTGSSLVLFKNIAGNIQIGDGANNLLIVGRTTLPAWVSVNSLAVGGQLGSDGGFGCNGKPPQVSAGLGAAATDLTSVITLANNIRTALINNGIGS